MNGSTPTSADAAVNAPAIEVEHLECGYEGKVVLKNQPQLVRQVFKPEISKQVVETLKRVVSTDGTAEKARLGYYTAAGKTGTAQGMGSLPWNDSSVFGAFSEDKRWPYTVVAYLEKSGFGAKAAAPVTKCVFLAIAHQVKTDPVQVSDPLNLYSTVAAPPRNGEPCSAIACEVCQLDLTHCGGFTNARRIAALALAGGIIPSIAMAAGMPQLDFANPLTISQVIWGAIIFIVLYIVLSRFALPRVGEVLEARASHIARDLEAARASKEKADAGMAEATAAIARACAKAASRLSADTTSAARRP